MRIGRSGQNRLTAEQVYCLLAWVPVSSDYDIRIPRQNRRGRSSLAGKPHDCTDNHLVPTLLHGNEPARLDDDQGLQNATDGILYEDSRQGNCYNKKRMGEKRTIESAEERERLPDSGRQLKQETRLREKAEEKLTDCFRFQRLLFDISTDSLRVSHDQIDSEIENALKRMLEFFQVDRCVMVKILRDGTSWQIAYAAFRDGLRDLPRHVDLPIDMYPWHFNRITECHEVSCYSSLDEIPSEAGIDRKNYEEWGIRSIVNVPIAVDGSLEYVMCISSDSRERVWPENYIPRMRMLGEIIVRSMQLSRARLRLEKRQQFEKLIADISAGFVTVAPDDFENATNACLRKICGFFKADRCSLRLLSEDETTPRKNFRIFSEWNRTSPGFYVEKSLAVVHGPCRPGKTHGDRKPGRFPE